jgi:hypothetical protein
MRMAEFKPWQKYSDLAEERLSAIATIIRDTTHEVVLLHEPEKGDGAWGLGCRAYERTCFAIRKAAIDNEWLTILEQSKMLEFGFAVGAIPFRFYRGKPDDPPDNYTFKSFGEIAYLQYCLDIGEPRTIDGILRLAVDVDASREVSRVTLVEMDDEAHPMNTWVVPFDIATSRVTLIQTPMVDLPPFVAEPLKITEEKEQKKENGLSSVSK